MNAEKVRFVASSRIRPLTNAGGFRPATVAMKFGFFPRISKTDAQPFLRRMARRRGQSRPFGQLRVPVPFGLAFDACRLERFRKAPT